MALRGEGKKDKEQGGRKEENLMQTEEGRYGMMK